MRTRPKDGTALAFPRRYSRTGISGVSGVDGSTLNLDFTTMGALDTRFTFTRSTTATYINSSGYVATMAAATTNDPTKARFDYDPTTLAPKGLLIEGSATNLVLQSESFGTVANWTLDSSGGTAINPVVTTVSATNPAGGSTVNQIVFNRGSGGQGSYSRIQQSVLTSASAYTISVWMRTVSGTSNVGFLGPSTNQNNVVTTTWKRFTFTFTATAASTSFQILLYEAIGSDLSATIYVWGAQFEAGVGASSYIPTVASQVPRAADECYMGDISDFNYSNTNGTIATQFVYTKQSSGYIEQIGFMTAGDQPTIEIFLNPSTSVYTAVRGASLNTGGANEIGATITLNTLIKYATSVNVVTNPIVQINMNGTAASTNKSGTGTSLYTATRFVFGRLPAASYGANYGSLTIKSVKYWNTTKTAAELAALTT